MSLYCPPRHWWAPVDREEKIWLSIALVWCLAMFGVMVAWAALGGQNPPSETYRIKPDEFARRAARFVAARQRKDARGLPVYEKGVPVVEAAEDEDSYLLARTWAWEPILVLKKDRTYRVRLSSVDLQHGFSLQPVNINLQVLPGYEYVARLTPSSAGEFLIVCNEYCGVGHHQMVGKILVEEE
ncbi:MAG: cytochrome C oxidase subunit II [Planctomycetes bacterium]|nr:cytochrome C oxidase subunit II [Planctomycetota bacterium]